MKKHLYVVAIAAVALVIALPTVSRAEDSVESDVTVQVQATSTGRIVPGQIRNMIRQDIQQRVDNMKNNQNSRNGALEGRTGGPLRPQLGTSTRESSSTMPFRDGMKRYASTTMMGSTSPMFRGEREGYMNNGREMLARMFKMRKEAVAHEADTALKNLSQIRERINSRIQKEQQAGRDMSAPISLLVTADAKIKIANDAVAALKSYMPNASSTTATSTVDLSTARTMLKTAQSAIKDAQKSLNDVVRALAKAMGLHLGEDNDRTGTASSTTATSTSN